MDVRALSCIALAVTHVLACATEGDDDSGDGSATVGGSESSGGPASAGETSAGEGSGGGTTASVESCAELTDEMSCEAASTPAGSCLWLGLMAFSPDTCTPGEMVGFCVEGISDDGCGTTPGCDGEAYYVELGDGGIAPFVTCGGPYPPAAMACAVLENGEGYDPPECGCVCEGLAGTSTG